MDDCWGRPGYVKAVGIIRLVRPLFGKGIAVEVVGTDVEGFRELCDPTHPHARAGGSTLKPLGNEPRRRGWGEGPARPLDGGATSTFPSTWHCK